MVMQMASKPATTVLALLASWLVNAAIACADASNGGAPTSGHRLGLVLINGDGEEQQREIVGQTIEAAVRDAGWSLPPKPLTKPQTSSMLACLDTKQPASCIPATLRTARVFVVTIENQQAENGAPMVLLIGKAMVIDPLSTAIRQQHCERCANNDLTAASAELAKIVLQDLALRLGKTIADFRSEPDGAEIVLDGRRIGITNARFNTYPGKHVVRFEKAGRIAQTHEFTAVEEQSVQVTAVLPSSTVVRPPVKPPSKLVPGVLLGASGVLVLIGAHGIYQGMKDDSDDKYRYPRATEIGVGSVAVGVGAAGVGLYLLWKNSRVGSPSSSPTVGVTSGGAMLGWKGAFR
jgi:hypothetical protein